MRVDSKGGKRRRIHHFSPERHRRTDLHRQERAQLEADQRTLIRARSLREHEDLRRNECVPRWWKEGGDGEWGELHTEEVLRARTCGMLSSCTRCLMLSIAARRAAASWRCTKMPCTAPMMGPICETEGRWKWQSRERTKSSLPTPRWLLGGNPYQRSLQGLGARDARAVVPGDEHERLDEAHVVRHDDGSDGARRALALDLHRVKAEEYRLSRARRERDRSERAAERKFGGGSFASGGRAVLPDAHTPAGE